MMGIVHCVWERLGYVVECLMKFVWGVYAFVTTMDVLKLIALSGEHVKREEQELWYDQVCWHKLRGLLSGGQSGARLQNCKFVHTEIVTCNMPVRVTILIAATSKLNWHSLYSTISNCNLEWHSRYLFVQVMGNIHAILSDGTVVTDVEVSHFATTVSSVRVEVWNCSKFESLSCLNCILHW